MIHAFTSSSKNGDGYLSWEEFTGHADLNDHQELKDAIELFKAADANGDGKVSKDEFIKLMSKLFDSYFCNLSTVNSAETLGGQ